MIQVIIDQQKDTLLRSFLQAMLWIRDLSTWIRIQLPHLNLERLIIVSKFVISQRWRVEILVVSYHIFNILRSEGSKFCTKLWAKLWICKVKNICFLCEGFGSDIRKISAPQNCFKVCQLTLLHLINTLFPVSRTHHNNKYKKSINM